MRFLMKTACLLFSLSATTSLADGNHSPGVSKWGAEDMLGAMNYLTPELALEASKLITKGQVVPLGIVTGTKTPAYAPRSFSVQIVQPGQIGDVTLGDKGMVYNDEILHTWVGIGSQLDGLGHVGINHVYYNNTPAAEFSAPTGLTKFGTEHLPPIATRGLMLDIAALRGVSMMKEGDAITAEDIKAAEARQGVTIRQGDVVLLHTGWLDIIETEADRFGSVEPGLGLSGADYLVEKGIVAVGADNWAVEVIPFEPGAGVFEVHQKLLAQSGTYILENMNTRLLVSAGVSEFMFVLGAARIEGTVQAMVNPVALY